MVKYLVWRQLPVTSEGAIPKLEYLHNDEHELIPWFWKPTIVGSHIFICEQDAKEQVAADTAPEHCVLMVYGSEAAIRRNGIRED